MADAVRTVDYTIEEGCLIPATPQYAGIQGEHQATKVAFRLPEAWSGVGYVYRVEYVDGWLGRHTSALLTPAQGSVSLLLPDSWTAAGGTGEIRLEAALLGGESSEEQILFTQAGRLYFSPRELGESGPRSREEGLSTLIAACLAATEKATAAAYLHLTGAHPTAKEVAAVKTADARTALLRAALGSVADRAIIPMYDWLGLGAEAHLNTPGKLGGNWAWRAADGFAAKALAKTIHDECSVYCRV